MKTREIAIFSIFSKQDTLSYGTAKSYQEYYWYYYYTMHNKMMTIMGEIHWQYYFLEVEIFQWEEINICLKPRLFNYPSQ